MYINIFFPHSSKMFYPSKMIFREEWLQNCHFLTEHIFSLKCIQSSQLVLVVEGTTMTTTKPPYRYIFFYWTVLFFTIPEQFNNVRTKFWFLVRKDYRNVNLHRNAVFSLCCFCFWWSHMTLKRPRLEH